MGWDLKLNTFFAHGLQIPLLGADGITVVRRKAISFRPQKRGIVDELRRLSWRKRSYHLTVYLYMFKEGNPTCNTVGYLDFRWLLLSLPL